MKYAGLRSMGHMRSWYILCDFSSPPCWIFPYALARQCCFWHGIDMSLRKHRALIVHKHILNMVTCVNRLIRVLRVPTVFFWCWVTSWTTELDTWIERVYDFTQPCFRTDHFFVLGFQVLPKPLSFSQTVTGKVCQSTCTSGHYHGCQPWPVFHREHLGLKQTM